MAKHEILIHENTGGTKVAAPYLGSYISKETVRLAGYAELVSAKCGLPAIQVQAIITGAFEAWEELEKEALTRIHTDIGTIYGIITGSFPTGAAPFAPAVNALAPARGPAAPAYAALLTPQGRFLYDLFLYRPPPRSQMLDRTGSAPWSSRCGSTPPSASTSRT